MFEDLMGERVKTHIFKLFWNVKKPLPFAQTMI